MILIINIAAQLALADRRWGDMLARSSLGLFIALRHGLHATH